MRVMKLKITWAVFLAISAVLFSSANTWAAGASIYPGSGGSEDAETRPGLKTAPSPDLLELQARIAGEYFFKNSSAPGRDDRFHLSIDQSGTWKAQSIYPIGGRTFAGKYLIKDGQLELATDMGYSFFYRIDGDRLVRTGERMFPGTAGEEIWVKSVKVGAEQQRRGAEPPASLPR